MTPLRIISLLSVCLALVGCDDGGGGGGDDAGAAHDSGGGGVDAGGDFDGGGGEDAGGGVDSGGGGEDAGTMAGCGTMRPDVSMISGTEGLVIARDGTIYYSQRGAVGRLVPGGSPEDRWVSVGSGGATVWGLALDAANETLYVGVPGTGVRSIDLTAATPSATTLASTSGAAANGLTMGPDGALYYSDFSAGRVYRVTADGMRAEVTASTIEQANGLAFLPDGTLLVASYGTGVIHRLTLTGGAESARETFASGLGAADGLALDADGNVYVGSQSGGGRLIRLAPDGSSPMTLRMGISAIANIEFGAGALDCTDLYITSSGAMQRYEAGVAGAGVPWH